MTDTTLMALGQGMQQLKGYPVLHVNANISDQHVHTGHHMACLRPVSECLSLLHGTGLKVVYKLDTWQTLH